MAEEENKSSANCCGGSTQNESTGCGCGGSSRRSGLRTVIFIVVMLTAVGVGAYSLWGRSDASACGSGQGCGSAGGRCCPGASK
jgi:hypothetical protein